MGLGSAAWQQVTGSRLFPELLVLPCLGAVAYLLFRHGGALKPLEGAVLIMATAGLLTLALHWWEWHWGMARDGSTQDWVQRILAGERSLLAPSPTLLQEERPVVAALNLVLGDTREVLVERAALKRAMAREWRELDTVLAAIQRHHGSELEARRQSGNQLEALGRELKTNLEDTLGLDAIELNHRLRADHFRLHGQSFRSTLEQVGAGLEHFENLLEELQDSFPRLRREEDALGRLADAGLRQGARLELAAKGLVAHTPQLVDETKARLEWLGRFRHSADEVRDKTEALARRIEGFRLDVQARMRSFGEAHGSMQRLNHIAQQTGLLSVNAAILAQQGGGSAGMTVIGERLRTLADQTAEGASVMQRTLNQYQQGMEQETAGLWDIQEVAEALLLDIRELLRTAVHLDLQGHELERALETHSGHVDQVRQSSERAVLSLHEIGARALEQESAHSRQWGVEAKLASERERLSSARKRLVEVGEELAQISQQNIDEIWGILARHQEIRRTESYRQITAGSLSLQLAMGKESDSDWNRIAWTRAQRRPRLAEVLDRLPPRGRRDSDGVVQLLLLGWDALDAPEPSALESWSCDDTGRIWDLCFLEPLRTESHRLSMLECLRGSALLGCFPGLDLRVSPNGVQIRLPFPYPGLPRFLAGLQLELPLEPGFWGDPFRMTESLPPAVQLLIWVGPGADRAKQLVNLRLIHAEVNDDPNYGILLPWLPYEGHRPFCPWQVDSQDVDMSCEPAGVRCLGLGADPAVLDSVRALLFCSGTPEDRSGLALCAIGVSHPHPEALLLRLFEEGAGLAGAFHPDLVPFQMRMREEVLGGSTGDPYRASWALLEELQRSGWLMPLPPA